MFGAAKIGFFRFSGKTSKMDGYDSRFRQFLTLIIQITSINSKNKYTCNAPQPPHKPLSRHPNAHTDEELKWIKDLIKKHKNDNLTLCEY